MEALHDLHTSIAQTFDDYFDITYRDLQAELTAYSARVEDAESRAKAADEAREQAVLEADTLRQEVTSLQEDLQHHEAKSEETEKATRARQQLEEIYAPRLVFENKDASDFGMLGDKYIELYGQVEMLVKTSGSLRNQTKRHKGKLEQWKRKLEHMQACLQRQEFSYVVDGEIVTFKRVEVAGSTRGSPPREAASLEAPSRARETFSLTQEPSSTSSRVARVIEGSSPDTGDVAEDNRPQGQRSEVASTTSDASTTELPHITSTVPSPRNENLKRKRTGYKHLGQKDKSSSKITSIGNSGHPIIVKSETMSSSPSRTHSPHSMPQSTQDLDDIGDTVVNTPTKRARFRKSRGLQSFEPLLAQHMVNERGSNSRAASVPGRTGVLQPVDGNVQTPVADGQTPKTRRGRYLGSVARISSLTEDDDANCPSAFAKGKSSTLPRGHSRRRHLSSDHRLSDLLEGQSPASRTSQFTMAPDPQPKPQSRTLQSNTRGSPITCHREINTTSNTLTPNPAFSQGRLRLDSHTSTLNKTSSQSQGLSQTEVMPDDEPYRVRPIKRLGLEHFRINPDFNNGLDFAYDDVIRRRDERKCINGCTRPGCCGDKFTAMVRFGIPLSTSGEDMSDREMLERYLGEGKDLIERLSRHELENLLVEAKAKVFSNRFGRHRHQHHRAGTPPGFWRTEMPGTQELEEDHEEARKVEREKVTERYREAMRTGGRWIFAD
ncbi:DNA repair protein endonuclease SAE2/CtIP C-terminus-domain-containing protein, partial [Aspergillus karnatakaensis]|uniref:DNA repair protein endonuclease SAE2/CtIP C-terminus-domain-containing protein n=1 Tax=Aspergillus karnatakaensis TaxID=1810916 RepID=UPI003CCD019F